MGNVPLGMFEAAERTRFILPFAPGLICELTPAGSPMTVNCTLGALPPLAPLAEMPREDEPLASRCIAEAESETIKSPAPGLGLNWISSTGCTSITFGAAPC